MCFFFNQKSILGGLVIFYLLFNYKQTFRLSFNFFFLHSTFLWLWSKRNYFNSLYSSESHSVRKSLYFIITTYTTLQILYRHFLWALWKYCCMATRSCSDCQLWVTTLKLFSSPHKCYLIGLWHTGTRARPISLWVAAYRVNIRNNTECVW